MRRNTWHRRSFHRFRFGYDRENLKPVLRCSICTGERVAGFRNIHTKKFQEVLLVRDEADLQEFLDTYGLQRGDVETIY